MHMGRTPKAHPSCRPGRCRMRRRSQLFLRAELTAAVIQGSPQIPAGDAAVRRPFRADLEHVLGTDLPLAVGAPDRVLDAEIEVGEDVRAPELEHQEHLRGPLAYPFHL